ncbi:MAG: hypothetical protein ACKVJH_09430, partial [Flavobacteriales bacterium]
SDYIVRVCDFRAWLEKPELFSMTAFAYLGVLIFGDWLYRSGTMPRLWDHERFTLVRWGCYAVGMFFILKSFHSQVDFIYFQF